jgi:hypothetical protein
VILATFVCVGFTSSTPYDPWYDFNHNGEIDIFDVVDIAGRYGTTGTPINTTALLLEMQDSINTLNTTLMELQAQPACVVQSGEYDGVVNADMVEYLGVTTINFATAFTTTAKPQMIITVVLKGAANGLTEGSAIKGVEAVKGAANNWTGFDLTVSKYSDGSSIDDTTQVYVTWIAIASG